jgi:hypothetical protein
MLFRFFGKLIGKAFFDKIPVNLCLNRQIYLTLLKKTRIDDYEHLDEFKHIDVSVFNSLKFFHENDLSQHEDVIEQFFEHSNDEGKSVELVPGGSSKRVNNDNKKEFIKLKCHYIGYKSCKPQLDQLAEGFYSVVPYDWIAHLTVEELEVQLCGQSHIDLDDWKEFTEYRGFLSVAFSGTIKNFWNIMETYNQQELGRVLQFCTGTSRVPIGGFAELES